MSAVNSIENTYSISWIRRRKAAQETTANSQTGIYHFCYGFEQFEKKFKNSKYKIVKISEPFKSQDQISISSYWTWRHSLTDISLSILHNFLQDEKVELQGEVENNQCLVFFKQTQMIELCRTEGQKLLFEGRYDRVVPAALESLKFSIEVYGLSSIELVPSYLILGEASIGEYFYWS